MLPYDEDRLRTLATGVDAWQQRLDYRGPLPRVWGGRMRRDLEAEAVAASTSMEGVPVTTDEVRQILAGQSPPEVAPESKDLVQGYQEAMSFVLRRADDPQYRWNEELIKDLHDRVLAGRYGLGAGRLRQAPAFVVNNLTGRQVFLPPAHEQVSSLLGKACDRMEGGHPHPALASAWIHVALAAIHPFRDGNGRSARVSASLAMYRGGFKRVEFTSLEEWWGRHLPDYYAAFECLGPEFDPDVDVSAFIEAHLTAQIQQIKELDRRERVERQIWMTLEEAAEDTRLDPRIANALWDAFLGREVTAGYYRALADVSPATATNDLASASAAKLLRAEGERRGRKYHAGGALFDWVAAALFIQSIPDDPQAARRAILDVLFERARETGKAFGL